MPIRTSEPADFPAVMQIIRQAQQYLKELGIDQWQDNYPNENTLMQDLAAQTGYVLQENSGVAAYFSLSFVPDKNYTQIDGAWDSEEPYGVIHRLAVKTPSRRTGRASALLDFAEQTARARDIRHLRADTHEDNLPMQKFLTKHRFEYRGIVYLDGVRKRLAFEKKLR